MKSKSETQANQNTTNADNRIAADGNAIVLGAGAKLEQLSDDVALAALDTATDTAANAFDLSRNVSRDAFDGANQSLDRSLDFGENIFDSANETLNETLRNSDKSEARNAELATALSSLAVQNVTKSANPDAANTADLIKYGTVAAAAVFVLPKLLKTLKS